MFNDHQKIIIYIWDISNALTWNQQFSNARSVCHKCDANGEECEAEVEKFYSQNYEIQQFLQNEMKDAIYLQDANKSNNPFEVSNTVGWVEYALALTTLPCRVSCNSFF